MKLSRTALIAALAILMLVFLSCSNDDDDEEVDEARFEITNLNYSVPVLCDSSVIISAVIDSDSLCELIYIWSCDSGAIVGEGSSIQWNTPFYPGEYNVKLIVTDGIEADAESIAVNVVYAGSFNSLELVSLREDSIYNITSHLSYEGDLELYFNWSCDGGEIVETDEIDVVQWIPPDEDGVYNVYLTVTDLIDSISSETTVNYRHLTPFHSVEILYDNPADYSYLMASVDYSGEDELHYIWQSDYGEFVETDEDSTIRWNHPASDGEYEITLVVTDLIDTISTTIYVPVEHLEMPEEFILPLAVGNRWVYEDYSISYEEGLPMGEDTDTIEYVVTEEIIYHDQACYLLGNTYYVNRPDGLYVCGYIRDGETHMYTIPGRSRKYPATESDISDGTVCSIDHEVETPVGTFSCVEYCYSDSDGDDGYSRNNYYCPGVGEIKARSSSWTWWTSSGSTKILIEYELH